MAAGMGKPMKGLLLLAGKPSKGGMSGGEAGPPPSDRGASVVSSALENQSFDEAFEAAKSGNKAAFRNAMIRAVRACVQREMADEY